jgi:Domain of unknown function (DUF4926)
MIKELDVVTLNCNFHEPDVPNGSKGIVVSCHDDENFEVEFPHESNEVSTTLIVKKSNIKSEREFIELKVLEILKSFDKDLLLEVLDFAEFLQHKASDSL